MKTLRKEKIEPVFMTHFSKEDFLPPKEEMEQGKIYISEKYETSNHLCLCGCGEQTVLPLKNDGWALYNTNGKITITPSILQRNGCKSHYIITDGIANFV